MENDVHDDVKTLARLEVRFSRKTGHLKVPGFCERCRRYGGRLVAHHVDYVNSLNILWLCPKCHINEHVGGEKQWKAKLTQKKADIIRYLYSTRLFTQKDLAWQFNVSQSIISNVVNNKTYK